MLADRLRKAWDERRTAMAIEAVMKFSKEGLLLGAGTVLVRSGGSCRDILIDPVEPRLSALLAAAHLRKPTSGSLTHLRKAAECWRRGEDAFAIMHLALSRLDRLERPEADAHRLFLADGLLRSGVAAQAIVDAIETSLPVSGWLRKYSPDQPRVPAGSGRTSGEWTTGNDSSANSSSSWGLPRGSSPDQRTNQGTGPPTLAVQQPQTEMNPGPILPAATAASFTGPEACHIAKAMCVSNTYNDVLGKSGGPANDNPDPEDQFRRWKEEEFKRCNTAELVCDYLEFVVDETPIIARGAVIFPDRGVVIMQKGYISTYYPRGEFIPPSTPDL